MALKEILEKCSNLSVYEQRSLSDEYVELIFYNKEAGKWSKIFTELLGPPIKPAGVKPTKDDLRLTKDYGGINVDQTLFKKDFNGASVIVMFWPWRDNTHTTLKIILLKEA